MLKGRFWLIPFWGYFSGQVGIQVMHDGNHGSYSRFPLINKIAALSIDFMGGSSMIWRSEHNLGHHVHTNHDNDPDTTSGWPIIRFNPETGHKWWHRYQHIYGWLTYAFVAPRWYFNDFALMNNLPVEQQVDVPRSEWHWFWFFKVLFPLWMIVFPSFYIGFGKSVGYYLMMSTFSSYCFALQFAPTHISADADFLPSKISDCKDWATLQVHASTNYSVGGFLATWFSGGLNYQIEHHLFPSIAHPYYPEISHIVQDACVEFGVPYMSHTSWLAGFWAHYDHLYRMGQDPKSKESEGRFNARIKNQKKPKK
jgi:linoleoyl-CoA desaturase